jgi:hypothetical protein
VISPDLTGGPHENNPGQVRGTLTTLAVSKLDADVIWAGSDDGLVHVTTNGGGNWTDVSADLPERWVTSVRTDPFSRETAYVTISGFRWAEPLPHVFRTTDLGSTWVAIAGNLPEAPANDLVADPVYSGRYFVATDVGVYQTADGGSNWSMLGADLPNVVVNSLAFKESDRVLIAGTYGRSFFGYSVGDVSGVDESGIEIPVAIGRTLPPHPNPAGEMTWIAWEISQGTPVRVAVYTVSGRQVWSKTVEAPAAGPGRVMWDGRDTHGKRLPPGAYFVRVRGGETIIGNETVVLLR